MLGPPRGFHDPEQLNSQSGVICIGSAAYFALTEVGLQDKKLFRNNARANRCHQLIMRGPLDYV
jgi:hypothetical protein